MKVFRVTGKFRMGPILSPFTMEAVAADDKGARDRIFATLGSRHRANRHQIWIDTVKEIQASEIQDPAVEKQLSLVK